jgi:hypothetical protein
VGNLEEDNLKEAKDGCKRQKVREELVFLQTHLLLSGSLSGTPLLSSRRVSRLQILRHCQEFQVVMCPDRTVSVSKIRLRPVPEQTTHESLFLDLIG